MRRDNDNKCNPQNDLACYQKSLLHHSLILQKDKGSIDMFRQNQEKINKELMNVIDTLQTGSDHVTDQIVALRNSYNHTKSTQKYTSGSIFYLIDKINKFQTIEELATIIIMLNRFDIGNLINVHVIQQCTHAVNESPKDSYVYIPEIDEVQLTLGTPTMYEKESKQMKILEDVVGHFYDFLVANWCDISSHKKNFVHNILVFEIAASRLINKLEERHNPYVSHNITYYSYLHEKFLCKRFWDVVVNDFYISEDGLISRVPLSYTNLDYLQFIDNLMSDANNYDIIRDYLIYCIIYKYGMYTQLVTHIERLFNDKFEESSLSLRVYSTNFGHYLEDVHDHLHYDSKKIEETKIMFTEMKNYFIEYIKKVSNFSQEAKTFILSKLETLDVNVGKQKRYYSLQDCPVLNPKRFFKNLLLMDIFHTNCMYALVGHKISRKLTTIGRDISSFDVNAFYDPSLNVIYIPTAIMEAPFMRSSRFNYGGLGAIIGHEIMHSFDVNGSKYDATGKLVPSTSDNSHLTELNRFMEKIKNHYNKLTIQGFQLDSLSSLGENFADIAGLKLSLRAYIHYYLQHVDTDTKQKALIDLFTQWATVFQAEYTPDYLSRMINTNVHSPGSIRINAPLSHIEEYYKLYDVKLGDVIYLPPEERMTFLD